MPPPSRLTSSPSDSGVPNGTLALIGGRFEPDNHALYAALRERCNGRIAVLSMASGYPEEVGREIVDEFRDQGFYVELVPIFFETRDTSPFEPVLIDRLRAFGSVFFSGGDQSRIVGTLIQNGQETPALTAIRELYAGGGLVAGSSAGAAIMSGPMILGGTSLNAIVKGIDKSPRAEEDFDAFRLGKGLGFFTWGMVDQHFLARGRIGRLICAAHAEQQAFAFGVDENSALLVSQGIGQVVGETGVLMIDLRRAHFDNTGYRVRDARLSYLDDGDAIDLQRGKPLPAADKKRARVSPSAYRTPAPVRRNAFAGYGLHDLMLRLVEGDPSCYRQDTAEAYDTDTRTLVTLRLSRLPRKSRALQSYRREVIRYSALNFSLDIETRQAAGYSLSFNAPLIQPKPAERAKLVLLGDSPTHWQRQSQIDLRTQLVPPVGILPTASGEPKALAERYLDWLEGAGIQSHVLPITLNNIERASRDRQLLRRFESMGSLLLTGGDQRRLTEALLHCADATPVLHSIVTAYERGAPLVAIAGAASAMGVSMIAEGDSVAALRYGSSGDASGSGVVIEPGIGVTHLGLVDQHFGKRHRLGRLLMACAEQGQARGFGICEGSALIIHGEARELEALGSAGIVIATLDLNRVCLTPKNPDPSGIKLSVLEPGHRVAVDELRQQVCRPSKRARALLAKSLADCAEDYRRAHGAQMGFDSQRWDELLTDG